MAVKNLTSLPGYTTAALDSAKIRRPGMTEFRLLWQHSLLLEPSLPPFDPWTGGKKCILQAAIDATRTYSIPQLELTHALETVLAPY